MSRKKGWKKRGGFNSYGKTALSADFKGDGAIELLQKIEKAGKSIEGVCKKAINTTLPDIEKNMKTAPKGTVKRAKLSTQLKLQKQSRKGIIFMEVSA